MRDNEIPAGFYNDDALASVARPDARAAGDALDAGGYDSLSRQTAMDVFEQLVTDHPAWLEQSTVRACHANS